MKVGYNVVGYNRISDDVVDIVKKLVTCQTMYLVTFSIFNGSNGAKTTSWRCCLYATSLTFWSSLDNWEGIIIILDNLRFTELEDRSQKLDLDKIRKLSNNSNYTNPNLDGIIKGNVINTPFYSSSSQVSQVPPTYHSTYSQPPQ
jgi:hypothetical protein